MSAGPHLWRRELRVLWSVFFAATTFPFDSRERLRAFNPPDTSPAFLFLLLFNSRPSFCFRRRDEVAFDDDEISNGTKWKSKETVKRSRTRKQALDLWPISTLIDYNCQDILPRHVKRQFINSTSTQQDTFPPVTELPTETELPIETATPENEDEDESSTEAGEPTVEVPVDTITESLAESESIIDIITESLAESSSSPELVRDTSDILTLSIPTTILVTTTPPPSASPPETIVQPTQASEAEETEPEETESAPEETISTPATEEEEGTEVAPVPVPETTKTSTSSGIVIAPGGVVTEESSSAAQVETTTSAAAPTTTTTKEATKPEETEEKPEEKPAEETTTEGAVVVPADSTTTTPPADPTTTAKVETVTPQEPEPTEPPVVVVPTTTTSKGIIDGVVDPIESIISSIVNPDPPANTTTDVVIPNPTPTDEPVTVTPQEPKPTDPPVDPSPTDPPWTPRSPTRRRRRMNPSRPLPRQHDGFGASRGADHRGAPPVADTTTFTSVPAASTVIGKDAWLGTKLAADDATATANSELPAPTNGEELPAGMPKTIDASDDVVTQPAGTTLIRIVFDRRLHYEFVAENFTAAQQIFTFLPQVISYGEGIDEKDIRMLRLVPIETKQKKGWITTSALAEGEASNSDASGEPGGSPFTNSDPDSNAGEEQSPSQKGATVGIAFGAVSIAVAYGAAMFLVARRYKRKKQAHRRASSVTEVTHSDMRYSGSGSPAAAMMGGALLSRDFSSYGGVAGGRKATAADAAARATRAAPPTSRRLLRRRTLSDGTKTGLKRVFVTRLETLP
ncbi:unnamed protein product [Parascedosporium putredinis]|uniref:Uncharacterized protein n=1 Tax=Parascedosporium putredinis TaxID=1442378 RepID=A0A9P1MD27_9PEZI|nr:unnamed protein product [Parascedosporium putredinis]CAI7998855.1 unnamed protein product [Parascedosporium putredinis]